MERKTEGVYLLVQDILRTISEPYGEDIIEDVFLTIENNPDYRHQYYDLIEVLSDRAVNPWIGKYTKAITGYRNLQVVNAKRSDLITTYTKLSP